MIEKQSLDAATELLLLVNTYLLFLLEGRELKGRDDVEPITLSATNRTIS